MNCGLKEGRSGTQLELEIGTGGGMETDMHQQALATVRELKESTDLEDILTRIRHVAGIPDNDHDILLRECLEDKEKFAQYWKRREQFHQSFSWAIPSMQALEHIAAFARGSSVIEIGSGKGLWAALLKKLGLDVVATDLHVQKAAFCIVEKKDFRTALAQYRRRKTLLMVWPPQQGQQGSEMAYETLLRFRGSRLIYVGEHRGGCTATDDFFQKINWKERPGGNTTGKWDFVNQIVIPRWPGIQDSCYMLQRNNPDAPHGEDELLVDFPIWRYPGVSPSLQREDEGSHR